MSSGRTGVAIGTGCGALEEAIGKLGRTIGADDYTIYGKVVDDASVDLRVTARDDACAECLVPKDIMRAIADDYLAATAYRLRLLTYPNETEPEAVTAPNEPGTSPDNEGLSSMANQFEANERISEGLAVRREVLGPDYVERAKAGAATSPFGPRWQQFLTEYCWGQIWGSDDLPRGTRSLITVALLAALGKPEELGTHIRGARRNGCSLAEVRGALMQAACYAGVPVGVEAFRVADRVWGDE